MATAFRAGAFQNNAFQIEAPPAGLEANWPRQFEEMLEDDTVSTIINQPLCAAVPLTLLPTQRASLAAFSFGESLLDVVAHPTNNKHTSPHQTCFGMLPSSPYSRPAAF
jgi:hypothetical protein